ncbi:hypothetical protein TNCV_1815471 [Trichonephila clavipes]|nr:hypothetical protein TNCV_1815471 [Trichonephila clavipes]
MAELLLINQTLPQPIPSVEYSGTNVHNAGALNNDVMFYGRMNLSGNLMVESGCGDRLQQLQNQNCKAVQKDIASVYTIRPMQTWLADIDAGIGLVFYSPDMNRLEGQLRATLWYPKLVTEVIDICVVKTWRAFQIANPDKKLSLSDVRRRIVFYTSQRKQDKRRRPQENKLMRGRVSTDVRLDTGNDFIVPTKTQKKCEYCKKKTTKVCDRCNVGIHDKCFGSFQTP